MNDVIENFHSVDFKYNSKKKSQTLKLSWFKFNLLPVDWNIIDKNKELPTA
jgi:hypothetical protein